MIKIHESKHLRLQQQVDCFLEADAREELANFVRSGPAGDEHEDVLKFLALILIQALEERAERIVMKSQKPVALIVDGRAVELPAVDEDIMSRCRQLICEMAGVEGKIARGTLILGIRGDSLEFQIEKKGQAVTIHLPAL
jgi:hypothetical protein